MTRLRRTRTGRPLRPLTSGSRRGLAPLELVLCLPILLCILALIIDIGLETKWKLRSLFAVRQAAWSQRRGRNGATDPRPAGWPANAVYEVIPGGSNLIAADPFASYKVARGPILQDPQAAAPDSRLLVNTDLLEVAAGTFRGHAKIDRAVPLLPKVVGVHFDVEHLLEESRWRYQDLGYDGNVTRRTLQLYRMQPTAEINELSTIYQQAAQAILQSPVRQDLFPLDRDREMIWWYGRAPDFHPVLAPACTLDPFAVQGKQVAELIERIRGVPSSMASSFRRLYRSILNDEQKNGGAIAKTKGPPPEGADWQKKLDDLTGFP